MKRTTLMLLVFLLLVSILHACGSTDGDLVKVQTAPNGNTSDYLNTPLDGAIVNSQ